MLKACNLTVDIPLLLIIWVQFDILDITYSILEQRDCFYC